MKRKRGYIRAADKIASLLADRLPPEQRAALRQLKPPAAQVMSMFDWDHIVLHAFDGANDWHNLQPMLRAEHREKSRRDTSIVAKTKRIRQANALHNERMLDLGKAVADRFIENSETLRLFRAKRRWPSRSFPKGRKVRWKSPSPQQREE
jgi:hypothetical protein